MARTLYVQGLVCCFQHNDQCVTPPLPCTPINPARSTQRAKFSRIVQSGTISNPAYLGRRRCVGPTMAKAVQSELVNKPQLPQTAEMSPELLPEVWRTVARATLAACESSLSAWLGSGRCRATGGRPWKVLAAACAWCLHGVCRGVLPCEGTVMQRTMLYGQQVSTHALPGSRFETCGRKGSKRMSALRRPRSEPRLRRYC